MLSVIIAIPQGDPGSIEIRPAGPRPYMVGPVLSADTVLFALDSGDFMQLSPQQLAERYAVPAFATLQNKLRERGYGKPEPKPHYCSTPTLDFVPYGEEWSCPECGKVYTKTDFNGDEAAWEPL